MLQSQVKGVYQSMFFFKSSPLKLIAFEQFSPDGVVCKTRTNVVNTDWPVLAKPNSPNILIT